MSNNNNNYNNRFITLPEDDKKIIGEFVRNIKGTDYRMPDEEIIKLRDVASKYSNSLTRLDNIVSIFLLIIF